MDRVSGAERIQQLDVLRGFAILFILFMNIPYVGGYASLYVIDPRWLGWTTFDAQAYGATWLMDGTMRGLLQLLFGAGMMIMTRRAMQPGGPVQTADIFLRRNLWLIVFGLFNVFVLMWPGDILLPYGIAAMFLFPFRLLRPRTQFAIGAALLIFVHSGETERYFGRVELVEAADAVKAKQAARQPLTEEDKETLKSFEAVQHRFDLPPTAETCGKLKAEETARRADFSSWYQLNTGYWLDFFVVKYWLFWIVLESFGTMLLGAALYQWGVIQGRSRAGLYVGLLALAGVAVAIRLWALAVFYRFNALPPDPVWVLHPFTREILAIGWIALVSLMVRTSLGAALLRPFEAPGRLPLSIYFSAAIVTGLLFAPFGFGLWGRNGAGGMFLIACAIIAVQVVAANLWLRSFETGPPEWLWKTLAYGRRQPFRRADRAPEGVPAPAE